MSPDTLIELAWQVARRLNFHRSCHAGQSANDGQKEAVAVIVEVFSSAFSSDKVNEQAAKAAGEERRMASDNIELLEHQHMRLEHVKAMLREAQDEVERLQIELKDCGLELIVRQLVQLRKGPEKDDYGHLRPTREVFDESVHLLVDAAIEAYHQQRRISSGCVSTDSEGGVRIQWIRPAASVVLVVPAAKDCVAYVYHELGELGNDYATEDATPKRLAYWLHRIEPADAAFAAGKE